MPHALPTSVQRWGLTPHANGNQRALPAPGPTRFAWMPRRGSGSPADGKSLDWIRSDGTSPLLKVAKVASRHPQGVVFAVHTESAPVLTIFNRRDKPCPCKLIQRMGRASEPPTKILNA